MPDVRNVLDPTWSKFQLMSTNGLIYAQQQLPLVTIDLSQYVTSYTITESVREISRSLDFVLDVADLAEAWRVGIGSDIVIFQDVMDRFGNITPPTVYGPIWFYGKVYDRGRVEEARGSTRRFRAYDGLTRLGRIEDTLVYTDKTMTEIAQDLCVRYNYAINEMVDTEVPVGQIIQGPGMTVAQVLEEAAQRTLRRSGRRFFVRPNQIGNALELWEMGYTGVQWDLGSGASSIYTSFQEEESVEDLRTSVQLVTEETDGDARFQVVGTRVDVNDPYYIIFGSLPTVIVPDNTTNAESNDEQLDAEYRLRNRSVRTATTNNLIIPGARMGDRVVFHLPDGTTDSAFISTIVYEYTEEPKQTVELVFDGAAA